MGGATRDGEQGRGVGADLSGEVEVAVEQLQREHEEEDEDRRQGHGRRRRRSEAEPGLSALRSGWGSWDSQRVSTDRQNRARGPFGVFIAHGPTMARCPLSSLAKQSGELQ